MMLLGCHTDDGLKSKLVGTVAKELEKYMLLVYDVTICTF